MNIEKCIDYQNFSVGSAFYNTDSDYFKDRKYSPTIIDWLDFNLTYSDFTDVTDIIDNNLTDFENEDFHYMSKINWLVELLNSVYCFNFYIDLDKYGNDRGFFGYKRRFVCSITGSILAFDGINEFNCNCCFVRFPGEAVRYLCAKGRLSLLLQQFNSLEFFSTRCVRIDLAKDCFTGKFDFFNTRNVYTLSRILTRLRKNDIKSEMDMRGNIQDGWTFYLGQRSAAVYVRVYDKRTERSTEELDSWVRFEFEIKHLDGRKQHADEVYKKILLGYSLSEIFKEYCWKYLRVLKENDIDLNDSNRCSKVEVDEDFLEFINYDLEDVCDKHKFCAELARVDFNTRQKNCQRQVFAMDLLAFAFMSEAEIIHHIRSSVIKNKYKYEKELGVVLSSFLSDNINESVPVVPFSITEDFIEHKKSIDSSMFKSDIDIL